MAISLHITDEASADWEPAFRVIEALNGRLEKLPEGRVNVKPVDEQEIADLNKQYTGNAYPTDVLSFSYIEDGEPVDGELGDIAVSLPAAAEQAAAAETPLATELALLALHGTLHILGHDHQTASQREEMDTLQRDIMTAAGLTYRDFGWLGK